MGWPARERASRSPSLASERDAELSLLEISQTITLSESAKFRVPELLS